MKVNVFTSGNDGYHSYRIPSIILTQSETLLAFCEGRRNNRRDHGDIDLLVKRSQDGGKTWSAQHVVYGEPGDITIGNPCPVVDQDTGTIWMLFCRDNNDVLITHSNDDGLTWSAPTDITSSVKQPNWGWYATGPGVGIQLQNSAYKGRLVIPCDHRADETYGNGSHAIYSDDHGKTWHISTLIQPGANECQVVELADGTLKMDIRMQNHSEGYRATSTSQDGGHTWTPIEHDTNLICPKCQASFIGTGGNRVLFSNPAYNGEPNPNRGPRENMTVRLSENGGINWMQEKVLHKGPSAYSCLTTFPNGDIACFYEAGNDTPYDHLKFERFRF